MATFIIPTPLRKFTQNSTRVESNAASIGEALNELVENYPDLKKHLLDDQGKLRSFINVFVGDDDIRDLQLEQTALAPNTVVSIVPAIAGGII
ncbi:MAG TPA: MoaD/ThiS family protein [Chitinophagales bacterium]|nr:MoaD/ThiS family protein [Chitinophagales bacterium]